ncbi:DUF1284 domain-containing protein [Gymnodinialimonas sp. 2305UL16-5]|uniref:DUF1284 domain-containing protein n=1 Tax=Gymnodinialimonas mytili TaxID=3126503 RepID=UPI0030AFF3E0
MRHTPLRFRPHHVLCSLGFEGHGYSDSFTANMEAIVMGRLRADGGMDQPLEITSEADAICAPCPRRRGTGCESQARIEALDDAHGQALGLAPGDQLSWGEALDRVRTNITPDTLEEICAGCQWLPMGLCKSAVARLQDNTE